MTRALLLATGAALCLAPTLAAAAPASARSGYTAPRNTWGQPDLGNYWTNVSLTPETRPPGVSAQAAYTPEQVSKIEGASAKSLADGDAPIDPNAPPPTAGGDKPPPGTRPEFAAAGGAVGGYNTGWLDPGSVIMRVHGEPRTSVITTPDGRAPRPKAGVKTEAEYRGGLGSFDNPENRSLGERCIMGFGRNAGPPMLANGFYNNDYQFVQTRDSVGIVVEMVHDTRLIRLNGAHRTDGQRPWMGDSIGHWEGDTLVVETTNIPERQAYHGAWKTLKVTERFRRTAPDRLYYAFTIDDPSVWDKPWGGEYEFAPLKGVIYEYACHEGNHALGNMLAGARAEEAKGKGKAAAAGGG